MNKHIQKGFIYSFSIRWVVCAIGLWIAAGVFRGSISYQDNVAVVIVGGALLALLNTILRPLLILISMPALLITLGLFMVVLNGLMVSLMSRLYGPFEVYSFKVAMATGIIVGLVNFLVTAILKPED